MRAAGAVLYFPPGSADAPRTKIDEEHNMWVRVRIPDEHKEPASTEDKFGWILSRATFGETVVAVRRAQASSHRIRRRAEMC